MIKPLLKVIPALSGNIKLACNLEKFTKIGEHTYKGICRNGFLYPLDSKAFQSPIEVSLLQSSWEYDIVKFYNVYKDIFYDNTFFINENKCLLLNDYSDVLNNRNVDVEFGCKRVSFQKSKKQLCFFAPIYCESFEDLPEYFEITMLFKNKDGYSVEKKLRIYLNDKDSYLTKYLERYFKKIDDNAIFFNPKASQATYYGINVKGGGLNKFVDNIVLNNFINETTVNQYDNIISSGFKRNGLILQQVMPLAFYFNPDDILSDIEKNKFKYFKVKLSGAYYKDNVELPFYTFDTNYTTLAIPTKTVNQNTGLFENKYNYDNILGIKNDKFALDTLTIKDYKTENKINVFYNRWKLKYSDDNNPYFTNTNYIFSKNQKSENMYYQYPQHYVSSLLTNITNNQINLILPIGKNIENFYDDYEYLVKNYYLSLDNYISNWFEMTDQTDFDYILSNTEWADVHNDNKIFYNGVLYDFNRISDYKNQKQFDKFAVLCYVDDSEILDKSDIRHYVVSKQSLTYFLNSENIVDEESVSVSSSVLRDIDINKKGYSYSLYDFTSNENNYKYESNQFFTYNTLGVGKYVNVFDLNKYNNLYFEANRFYPISSDNYQNIVDFYNEQLNTSILTSINIGYVLIDIPFSENIISNFKKIKDENIYFCTSLNSEKLPLSKIYSFDFDKTNKYNYILFYKCYLVPENIKSQLEIIFPDMFLSYPLQFIDKQQNETLYCECYPIYQIGNLTLKNIFVPTRIYDSGDIYYNINKEKSENLILLDPINLSKKLNEFYVVSGELYIENILENKIVLGDLNSDNLYNLYFNDRKDEILELFESTYTYSYNFGGNKYNVEKIISKINGLLISNETIIPSKTFNVVSYTLDFTSPNNYISEYNEIKYISNTTPFENIISYTIDLSNLIFEKNIETSYNRLNNCCSVDIYAYTYSIDYVNNIINIKSYNGDNIDLYCENIEQTYSVAYQCGMLDYVEMPSGFYSYIQKFNGAGTYFNGKSVMFNHPQKLIKTISGLPYGSFKQNNDNIITFNDNVKFEICDFSELKKEFNVKNTQSPFETKLEQLVYNYPTSSIQFIKLKNKNHLDILFRKYLNDNIYRENISKTLSLMNKELYHNSHKINSDTYKYIVTNKSNIIPIFIRIHLYENDINILSSQMYSTVIPIFVDASKYNMYSDDCLVFGINEINSILNNFSDCIFTLSDFNKTYRNNFINYVKTISNISITNDFKFELYYTNKLVYLTKDILNKIINIESDTLFKDIYLYELEETQSITSDIQYFKKDDLQGIFNFSNKYFFNPLFNDVYLENKKDTIIYQSFVVDNLIEVKSKSNSQNAPIFYKYKKQNKIMMIDVSEIYNTDTYSFIYNTKNENYTAYSYTKLNEETGELEIFFTPANQILTYNFAYYSSSIPTYDKYIPTQIGFKELPENIDSDSFAEHNLNILVDSNGTKYGLYLINIPFNNISNSFNIITDNNDDIKYFTSINGTSIINNHSYLTKCFKYIVPILKHNILNELHKIDCANIIFNTKFNKRYSVYDGKLILKRYQSNIISLNRYYDNIVPYLYKTTNLDDYSIPVRTNRIKKLFNFYTDKINIYNYTGIPIENNKNKKIKPFVEYKYFNDNQFINLEKEINIFVSDKLTYNEVLTLQEISVMQKYFKKYINSFINIKFSDEEMLFLYNKYSVIILATPLQIANNQSEKYYSVKYKFTLN